MSRKPRTIEPTLEQKARRAQELEDVKTLMQTSPGRRFFWRMLTEGNIFRSTFTGNSTTFYLEGKRDAVLPYYQDIMEACPEQFWVAQSENHVKSAQEENIHARPDDGPDGAGTD